MSAFRELAWIIMLPCSRSSELLSRSMDERLPVHLRAAVWRHLLACRPCRHYRDQLQSLREMLKHIRPAGEGETAEPALPRLSSDARERICRALHESE